MECQPGGNTQLYCRDRSQDVFERHYLDCGLAYFFPYFYYHNYKIEVNLMRAIGEGGLKDFNGN